MAKKKPGVGRKRSITPEKAKAIIRAVALGGSLRMAAKVTGVGYSTINDEIRRNPAFKIKVDEASGKRFLKFQRQIDKMISKSSLKDIVNALKILYPNIYQQKHDVSISPNGSISKPTIDLEYMPLSEADMPLLGTPPLPEAENLPESDSA